MGAGVLLAETQLAAVQPRGGGEGVLSGASPFSPPVLLPHLSLHSAGVPISVCASPGPSLCLLSPYSCYRLSKSLPLHPESPGTPRVSRATSPAQASDPSPAHARSPALARGDLGNPLPQSTAGPWALRGQNEGLHLPLSGPLVPRRGSGYSTSPDTWQLRQESWKQKGTSTACRAPSPRPWASPLGSLSGLGSL